MYLHINGASFFEKYSAFYGPKGRIEASSMGLAVSQLSIGVGLIHMGFSPTGSRDGQLSPYLVQLCRLARQYLKTHLSAIQLGRH